MNLSPHQILNIIDKIKNENKTIGVAVEGGGLRGIVSASLLECLLDLGLRDSITAVSGTSSGAINAAYFLNNQMDNCFGLYREMASSNFIQPTKWPNAMNLDFLFNDQITHKFPLDLKNLKENPIDFYITVTSTETGITRALRSQDQKDDNTILNILRASASAPLYTTNQEEIDGEKFNDGHVQMAIPTQPLIQKKVDYIFCLMTQKKGYSKKSSILTWLHQTIALRNYSNSYRQSFSQVNTLYNQQLQEIYDSPRVIPFQIEGDDFLVSKMSTDPSEMDRCRLSVRRRFLGQS